MKTRRILLLVLLVATMCVFWFYFHRPAEQPAVEPVSVASSPADETNQTPRGLASIQKNRATAQPAVASEPTPESNPAAWIEKRRKQIESAVNPSGSRNLESAN